MNRVISIDGPAASGKSSVAKALAKILGWSFVNSGEFYRATTWAMLDAGVDVDNEVAVAEAAGSLELSAEMVDGISQVTIEGKPVASELMSSPEVNGAVSKVARVPAVRELVVERLRALADAYEVTMEGRDIGSVVFPETPYKFYVDASEEVRQQRRAAQGLTDQIAQRDRADSQRKSAPLTIPQGAVIIDSSEMTIDEVVTEIGDNLENGDFDFGGPRP
ncbi:(d)CMP kinase [Sulfuriroseicoccus oceanibius]|uniref:Cytidylate kinase n=1 Tax=Sulfuriroseicoccus oceanibius TaxID=2707525 RepID=A0A6B3L6L6_9BACT|nr:(d)CMP kinase [Sulfuriroseicoccus oceanibius]QQL46235.1 (d)CMP kinase [Sulfuriroseicoccus oceanibius]